MLNWHFGIHLHKFCMNQQNCINKVTKLWHVWIKSLFENILMIYLLLHIENECIFGATTFWCVRRAEEFFFFFAGRPWKMTSPTLQLVSLLTTPTFQLAEKSVINLENMTPHLNILGYQIQSFIIFIINYDI